MRSLLILIALLAATLMKGQSCTTTLSGHVLDKHEEEPLMFANIYIEEAGRGTVADTAGYFSITDLCPGDYHVRISHIGCEPVQLYLKLTEDTGLTVMLEHHATFLDAMEVEGSKTEPSTRTQHVISREELSSQAGKPLAEIVAKVPGVNAIKGGSGLAKPVIHGMYGNRIAILNNGIAQAGQQWGNDHAPEVDPFAAKSITVIKGVETVEYGGNSLGGAILIEPGTIGSDPHLHGSIQYLYNTNGRGHTVVRQVEHGNKYVNWRLTGTFKQLGDRHTPDYYLTNTGNDESNFSVQLSKTVRNKWFNNVYYSLFRTDVGILRGAHVGNLTDLEEVIGRDEPLYTKETFSYELTEPRQKVWHQLLKANTKYYFRENLSAELVYGAQRNRRREYDVRRGDRSDVPAMDLFLESHFLGLSLAGSKAKWEYKGGLQYKLNDNSNDPETGILPLIPDYEMDNTAVFGRVKFLPNSRTTGEAGARYDLIRYRVQAISNTIPRVIELYRHDYNNFSVAAGLKRQHKPKVTSALNVGLTRRSPEINELYSSGLHQGAAGIEEGNTALRSETGAKAIYTNNFTITKRLSVNGSAYFQYVEDYIYLQPQNEFRLTIRGAYPLFIYRQTNATIKGLDLAVQYEAFKNTEWQTQYAMIRGNDVEHDLPLVYMPADQISTTFTWKLPLRYALFKGSFESLKFSLDGQYVFEQTRLEEEQDFLPPPDAYWLTGIRAESQWKRRKLSISLFVQVENLLNVSYRDYLNRLRYYADEEGRNIRIGIKGAL